MRATKRPGYLETVNERVVVFDGAFGTYVQDQNLTADDFGGQHLEGCNELLAITRPDLIAKMHGTSSRSVSTHWRLQRSDHFPRCSPSTALPTARMR